MNRRFKSALLFSLTSITLLSLFFYHAPQRLPTSLHSYSFDSTLGLFRQSSPPKPLFPDNRPLHISFLETGGSHDEVLAALVNSWGKLPGAKLSFFQRQSRYGSFDIMRKFDLSNTLPNTQWFQKFMNPHDPEEPLPDIVVSTTCEMDSVNFKQNLTMLLDKHHTYLFCVIHHADRWATEKYHLEEALTPWVRKNRVEFLGLSPHTSDFLLNKSLSKWKVVKDEGVKPIVRDFAPVYPVELPQQPEKETKLDFGLQGDFGQERRDYKMVFSRLGEFVASKGSQIPLQQADNKSKNVTLHLVGHGNHPQVPENVKSQVVFDENLNYSDFYAVLSKTFALLPAFATDTYLDRKASSSVPASLIAGTPLVATKEILKSYSYLREDIVWLQNENETDFDVIGRVLNMKPSARQKKIQKVKKHRNILIAENCRLARIWTEEAFLRTGVLGS